MILCRYAEIGRRGGFKIRCHNDVWVRVPLPAPYNHHSKIFEVYIQHYIDLYYAPLAQMDRALDF